ncbi:glycosyltransferase family 2 protein [Marinobacter pelagius]|nr:glycosyltransferase family 2 protein [Marinobacter sp. C7]
MYNVEQYVGECLESVRQQTYENVEIIVVEDCSTDDSLKALEPHLADERVRLVRHEQNGGLSAARNTGIEAASGDFIVFVDSDDVVDHRLVECCVSEASKSGAEIVLYGFVPFQDGEDVSLLRNDASSTNMPVVIEGVEYFRYHHFAWLKFIRLDLLDNDRMRFPVGQYYEDWPFHWQAGFQAQTIVLLPENLYFYRQRGDSITGSGGKKLFHIFSSQRLVADVEKQSSSSNSVKRVLAKKIYSGIWFVLTNIDDSLLPEAIARAKEHLRLMNRERKFSTPGFKVRVLVLAMHLPATGSKIVIRMIRKVLPMLSKHRRAIRRN